MPVAAPIAGAVASAAITSAMSDKGGGGGQTTSSASSAPWEGQQRFLLKGFDEAERYYGMPIYNGPMLADQSPYSVQAQNLMAQRGLAGSPLNQAAGRTLQDTLSGKYLSADSNPYLSGAVDTALRDVQTRVNSQFGGGGANYGGTAQQEWLSKNMANTALPIYAQNYANERGLQNQAMMFAPTLAAQDYTDIGAVASAGQAQEQRGQAEIQAKLSEQDQKWQNLQKYMSAIQGNYGQTSQASQPYFTNPMANALGLGLGGMQLYNGLSKTGLFGSNTPMSGLGVGTTALGDGGGYIPFGGE